MAGCYAIVGYGLSLLLGLCGQVSIGHAGFFALGAYTAGILTTRAEWPFLATLVPALVLGGLLGAALAAPALRVKGPYLAMLTIAFGLVCESVLIEAEPLTGGFNGLANIDKPVIAGVVLGMRGHVGLIVGCAIAIAIGYAALSADRFGKRLRAVRDSEIAARAIGLDPVRLRTRAFAISAAVASLGGAFFAPLAGFISPDNFGLLQSILFLLLVILGGVGTLTGPPVGALIVAGLPEVLASLADYRLMIFGVLLLIILRLRPDGLAAFWELGTDAAAAMAGMAGSSGTPDRSDADQNAPTRNAPTHRPGDAAQAIGWLAQGARPGALRLRELSLSFGGLRAVDGVSFDVPPGQVRGLIGPNGAGKTSLLNLIGGFYPPDVGMLSRGDVPLSGLRPHQLAAAGIARTFQAALLFGSLSVRDNVALALPPDAPPSMIDDLLALVGFERDPLVDAGALAFVDRRLVEIARALACRPDTLLLDEPAAGLPAADKDRLAALLRRLGGAGLRVILVEHDVPLVMRSCDRIAVLDSGRLIADGSPAHVRAQPDVIAAYLGAADVPRRRPMPAPDHVEAGAAASAPMLAVHELSASYGALKVLDRVDVEVRRGEVVALTGANGAGKSTLMRTLTGLLPATGELRWQGRDLAPLPVHARVAAGLALVPEGRQVFPDLSVADNLRLGGWTRTAAQREATLAAMLQRFPRLAERLSQPAGTMSGGEQQMLAIARALMSAPELVLLDEPSLGLAPKLVADVYLTIDALAAQGRTLLLVDQFARAALAISDRAYLLGGGRIQASGDAAMLLASPELAAVYLGETA